VNARALAMVLLGSALAACAPQKAPDDESAEEHAEAHGDALVLSAEERANLGLVFARPEPLEWAPEVRVFGRVVHDPAASTRLAAPYAGRLHASGAAPVLGTELEAGRELFRLEPRWTPQELADLAARRATAAAERAAAEAELPALHLALERAQRLNAADQSVSQRELEETESRVRVAEARAEGARAVEASLATAKQTLALVLPRGGTLVALDAHDGEEVEAGRELARVEDLRAVLVALDLPPGRPALAAASRARVELDTDAAAVDAERVGLAPESGAGGIAPALLVRVAAGAGSARPGQAVRAWLPSGAAAQSGVRVPSGAIVRLAGRAFVYARATDDGLHRVPVALDQPVPGGWFVTGLDAEHELVVEGSGAVLSFELLGRQASDEED
jgi:biotin carboxyl carrier protein